jgi:adenine-specific DNA-methyltransferase
MRVALVEDKVRKISSRENNVYVANGIGKHRPTKLAPTTFFQPITKELEQTIASRHLAVENILKKALGKPFYSEMGFILYQGDSTKILERLKNCDFRVDLTLTSPPYNIGKEYESQMPVEEYIKWCSCWIRQIYELTKENGAFWLNLGYLEVPQKGLCVPISYLLWNKSDFYLLQEVVWKYGAGVSAKHRLSPRKENWLFYVKNPKDYTFNLDEIRDPNVKYPNQKKNGRYRCNPFGKNPSDVWEFPKITTGDKRSSKERTGHPAQFPLAVVERIINASSNKAEIIIDPFAGSASAGIAAYSLGRIFVGFEIDPNYCRIAVDRFKKFRDERRLVQSQRKLF